MSAPHKDHPNHRIANAVATVLSPSILSSIVLVVAGFTHDGQRGLWWALGTAALLLGLPMAALIYLSRRGVVDTRYVRRREQRFPVYGSVCLLMLTVLAIHLIWGKALGIPWSVTVTAVFLLIGVATLMVLTLKWKISAHTAMGTTFAIAIPVLTSGWLILISWTIPLSLTYSRMTTRDHTYWQAVVGVWVGALIGALYALALHTWV